MAAATISDFQKFSILTVDPVPGANMRHPAKFNQDRSNGRRYKAVRHLGFVGRLLGPPTMSDHLVVSIVTPNLVKIDAVVSIT